MIMYAPWSFAWYGTSPWMQYWSGLHTVSWPISTFSQVWFVAKPCHENIIDQIIHIKKCSTFRAFQKLVSAKAGCAMLVAKIANGLVITDNQKMRNILIQCAFMITGILNKWMWTSKQPSWSMVSMYLQSFSTTWSWMIQSFDRNPSNRVDHSRTHKM